MSNSTSKAKRKKDFPLSFHKGSGLWCKTLRGKRYYFDSLAADPKGQKSVEKWLVIRDDILAGRTPRKTSDPTLLDLCNEWCKFKQSRVDSGELGELAFYEYKQSCKFILSVIDKQKPLRDFTPSDFAKVRTESCKTLGVNGLAKRITILRSLFKFAFDFELIPKPIRFGPGFDKPSAKLVREAKIAKGAMDFQSDEIRKLLNCATTTFKAMILLGVNGGLGNTDVCELPLSAIDLKSGWMDYPRKKTATLRRIPLWKETVAAIELAISQRPSETKSPLAFLREDGSNYIDKSNRGIRLVEAFRKVADDANVVSVAKGFYCLRRTFQTQAEECGDLVAVKSIMGHVDSARDMSARYRQRISDTRLQAAVEVVRQWLFGDEVTK